MTKDSPGSLSDSSDKQPRRWLPYLARRIRRLFQDRGLRSALFAFTLTRFLILFIFVLSFNFHRHPPERYPQAYISLTRAPIAHQFRPMASWGDAAWYIRLAREGYEHIPFDKKDQHTWAFFPLYPLMLRGVAAVTGGYHLTGMALSGFFFLLALVMLHRTAEAFGYERGDADRALFYTAAFPVSYFFTQPQTESLYLLLITSSFYAAKRDAWWTAGVMGALASATRFTGILVFLPLAILYWQRYGTRITVKILSLLLVPAGLLFFMLYLYLISGEPLAFYKIQSVWGREFGFFLTPLLEYLKSPAEISVPYDFRLFNFLSAVLVLTCSVILFKRREWAFAAFTLASILVPLSTSQLISINRYAMVIFPVFLVLARAGRHERTDQVIRAVFLTLLGVLSALFASNITFVSW